MKNIAHGPAFDITVIGRNRNVGKYAENAYIFPYAAFVHLIQNKRCRVMPEFSAIPSRRPFNPKQGNTHYQKTYNIGNDKSSPTVVDRLNGKT